LDRWKYLKGKYARLGSGLNAGSGLGGKVRPSFDISVKYWDGPTGTQKPGSNQYACGAHTTAPPSGSGPSGVGSADTREGGENGMSNKLRLIRLSNNDFIQRNL
jgi:hypothetical protein